MKDFIEKHTIETVQNGLIDTTAKDLLAFWLRERRNPRALSLLAPLADNLLLTAGTAEQGNSPQIIMVGSQTMFSAIVPHAAMPEEEPSTYLDGDFRNSVHVGYHLAISGEPAIETISTTCRPYGQPIQITYDRLILPWRMRSGHLNLTTYVKPLEILPQNDLTNLGTDYNCSEPTLNRRQLTTEDFPNEYRQARL